MNEKIPVKEGMRRVWILISIIWSLLSLIISFRLSYNPATFFLIFALTELPISLTWLIYWAYIGFPIKIIKKRINTKEVRNTDQIKSNIKIKDKANRIVAPQIFLISRTNAWKRFFARCIDVWIFAIIFAVIVSAFYPSSTLLKSDLLFGMVILFIWIFIESFFLQMFGSTFGKWLLRINIRKANGTKLSYLDALQRSFSVWAYGLGIGFPVVALFTEISAYSDLTRRGATSWDKERNLQVTYQSIGVMRIAIVALLLMGFVALFFMRQ